MNEKYAIVTGSTKGIGRAIAIALLQNGYHVIMNYATDDIAYQTFLEENQKYKNKIDCIKLNLNTYENAMEFCKKVLQITQKIDVFILNCGVTEKSEFGKIDKSAWENAMNINLNCPFYLIQGLNSCLRNSSAGRIILISSIMGKYPHSTSLVYNVSKAAVISLCKSLVKYFCENQITVNCICPGFIDTPYHKDRPIESYNRICKKIALHRFGTAEEVASICMEIIKNQYINGASIDIHGGYDYF